MDDENKDFLDKVSDFLERYKKPIAIGITIATLGAGAMLLAPHHGEDVFHNQGQSIPSYENAASSIPIENITPLPTEEPVKNNGGPKNYFLLASNFRDMPTANQLEGEYYDCLVNQKHIPPENVILLQDATSWDVLDKLDEIEAKSDGDDSLLVHLNAHGVENAINFMGGPILYDTIDSHIPTNLDYDIVLIDSCESWSAIPILEHENRFVMTPISCGQLPRGKKVGNYFFRAMGCNITDPYYYEEPRIEPDRNGDGKISIGEAAYYTKRKISENPHNFGNGTFERYTPMISDPSKIADKKFLP